jgi:hypothetical protein
MRQVTNNISFLWRRFIKHNLVTLKLGRSHPKEHPIYHDTGKRLYNKDSGVNVTRLEQDPYFIPNITL